MNVLLGTCPELQNSAMDSWLHRLPIFCDGMPESQVLHRDRNAIFRAEHAGTPVAIKRFFNRGWWKRVAYRFFVRGKARRSFDHSLRLRAAGLHSPAPLAWVEFRRNGWLTESFYVSRLQEYWHDGHALREPGLAERESKAKIAGAAVGRMHEAGIAHLDLNGGNLLFFQDSAGNWDVSFIDNNRMSSVIAAACSNGWKTAFSIT